MRVRLRISREDKGLDVIAVVNAGYEADTPQLMIPIGIAEELGLWPPKEAFERVLEV